MRKTIILLKISKPIDILRFTRLVITSYLMKLARVAELADAQDLKSCEGQTSYRFDSGLGHH